MGLTGIAATSSVGSITPADVMGLTGHQLQPLLLHLALPQVLVFKLILTLTQVQILRIQTLQLGQIQVIQMLQLDQIQAIVTLHRR